MRLQPALLRPDEQEIEHRQHKQQRRHLKKYGLKTSRTTGWRGLRKRVCYEKHALSLAPASRERRLAGRGGADYRAGPRLCNRAGGGLETHRPMPSAPESNEAFLARIAAALERIAPPPPGPADLSAAEAFVWRPAAGGLRPVEKPARVPLDLILGVDRQRDAMVSNTKRFASGAPANNALLWGARGAGKSALIKAVHAAVAVQEPKLKLVEIAREDLPRLADLLSALQQSDARTILFIDDLSFEQDDDGLRALKPVLDGGVAGRPDNVIIYATSNRRHLIARDPHENNPGDLMWADTAEERLSLADRFGLWLGFHAMDQELYLAIVRAYAARFSLTGEDLEAKALTWSRQRGARSGRTAWQFILDLAAAQDRPIAF